MVKNALLTTFGVLPLLANAQSAALSQAMQTKVRLQPKVEVKVQPFALNQVRLLPSPFRTQMERNGQYLLTLDPKRLLHRFYENNKLEPLGEIYGGWERDTISGHSFGHWLTGLALSYAATGDEAYKTKALEAVALLKQAQDAREDGFVGGYPNADKLHDELRKGEITSRGFDLNGLWVPWYNQHKLFAGLLDVYLYCGDPKALEIARKLGDFSIWVTANLDEAKWQQMLDCEFGGMNEVLADLAALTGEQKYLDLALKFDHKRVMDPLAEKRPALANVHGNTQIPKAVGAARIYELTGSPRYQTIAEYFWDQVVEDHTYANGGNTSGEYFGPPGVLSRRLSDSTSETCNTYNMLKLSEHLYAWTGDAKYQDYYERAMWNHILGSQNTRAGKTYYVPLRIGGRKTYSHPTNHFTCCHGSGMESHAKFGTAIFAHTNDTVFVNQFVASELIWEAKNLKLRLDTDFPNTGKVKLTVVEPGDGKANIAVRWPDWATAATGPDGKPLAKPENGVTIFRAKTGGWKAGDTLEVNYPLAFRTEPLPDEPQRVALFYGPILLGGDLTPLANERGEVRPLPVLITNEKPVADWLKPQGPLTFKTEGVGQPQEFTLKPFYEFENERYTVYWDMFTAEQWAQRQEEYRAEEELRRELEVRTVDYLAPGNMQAERDHNVQGEGTSVGDFRDRTYRQSNNGGWFSFDLKVDPVVDNALLLTFWGTDGGNRTFDVLIDGVKVREIILERNKPNEFYDERIELPKDKISGKSKITVRLNSRANSTAGGLFGARIVRVQPLPKP